MTKAQRRTKKAIAAILDAAGLYQGQLAQMIGASLDTVKAWTRKKNPSPISPEFETRILIQTGANIRDDGSVVTSWRVGSKCGLANKPFTKASFDFWVKEVSKPELTVPDKWIEPARQGIELLLKAATKGQTRIAGQNNFAALLHVFEDWIGKTAKDFNLERPLIASLNALPKEKQHWRAYPNQSKIMLR